MASHVTDAGVMDIYATVPREVSPEASDWGGQISAKEASSKCETRHVQAGETEQAKNIQREEVWHVRREETEHFQAQETEQIQQCGKVSKLPVFRPSKSFVNREKGKATEKMATADDSDSDSDSDYDAPPSESNSSADDDEMIEYRKYAQ